MGGGAPESTKQSTTVNPWGPSNPYRQDALQRNYQNYASGEGSQAFPYSKVASYTPLQQMGQNLGMFRGYYGSGVANEGNNMLMNTLGGAYLNPQSNPYLQSYANASIYPMMQQYTEQIAPTRQSTAQQAGRYGSGAQNDLIQNDMDSLMRGMGNTLSGIYAPAYQQERQMQNQAAMIAPQYAQNEWTDIQNMMGIGGQQQDMAQKLLGEQTDLWDYYQGLPSSRLGDYTNMLNAISGQGQSSTSKAQMPGASGTSGAIGGGLAGAGLTAMLGMGGGGGSAALAGLGNLAPGLASTMALSPWMWPIMVGGGALLGSGLLS